MGIPSNKELPMLKINELRPGIIVYACVEVLQRNKVDTTLRVTHPLLCLGVNEKEGVWAVVTSLETSLELRSRWKIGPSTWIKKRSFIHPERATLRIPNDVLMEAAEAGEADYYRDSYERPGVKPSALQTIIETLGVGNSLPSTELVNINDLSITDLELLLSRKHDEQRKEDLVLVLKGIAKDAGFERCFVAV